MLNISKILAEELSSLEKNINATIQLLDEGATVPFIARYRKEVTGGLDDISLRKLEERLNYLRELEDRKQVVLKSIKEQEKLTPELEKSIDQTLSKTELEDIYRPYMPKRRTKAQIAKEAGLEPLALKLLESQDTNPETEAEQFLNPEKEIKTANDALDGAKQILMELFSDDAQLSTKLREYLWENAEIQSKVIEGQEQAGNKFTDYFDTSEPVASIPSHRALAIYRGRNEGFLQLNLVLKEGDELININQSTTCANFIVDQFNISENQAASKFLRECARWAWRIKLSTRLDTEIKLKIKESAEEEAIKVFSTNLHDLLMAAPAGS
ncbi:MAG: Tex-like N-terminal domain-containing protein, partial [Gammaproteobacteria bacterium]|nr:Tex-like N-terminal domain-containing protein [Gammaproteobacteria bacterium]